MGPRWVAELPQGPAGRGGKVGARQSVLRKRDGGERVEGGQGGLREWGAVRQAYRFTGQQAVVQDMHWQILAQIIEETNLRG